ncbi:MAG TPA: hybrid sensor histidine kinase/response regulator [Roseiflexaceae bacterium]|jgi:signal transduction histidine kinase|nr:hybrid sensor histidine kinase/response regulator [Roseiflexaceae bacterium]
MPNKPCILYIEDNLNNQRLVQVVLEARGYKVVIARDGPEGLARAREMTPELILVDLGIPGLDGFETTTRLRSLEHLRSTPILALTADVQAGTRERSLAAGCDGYITKPIDARQLPQQIQEFVNGKREALPTMIETSMLREYTQRLVERLEKQVRDLTLAHAELHEVNQHKDQFLALLSHELRTPLTAVLGFVELFERGTLGPLTAQQHEAITVIARNTNTLVRQLNNLLFLQEVRSAHLQRAPAQVDDLLRRLLYEFKLLADAGQIELRAALPKARPYNGDLVALEHAFRHLIDNAIKFTPRGGQIAVIMRDEPTRLIVAVQDTGIGLAPEQHEKIFLPFYQVDSSLARPYAGVGIGLTIVKHVVEAHHGQLTVRSIPGKGSLFTMTLPRTA